MVMLFGEHAAPVERDAEQLAHLAVGAVGADEVLTGERALGAAVDVPHGDRDAGRILPQRHDLVPFEHLRAGLPRAPAQDRLESRLGDEQPAARAERFDAGIEAADDVRELLAGQAVHGDDRAFGEELLLRLAPDLILDAGEAEQLQGAQVKMRRARNRRAAAQPLDHQRGDAVLGEKHRGRQADQAAAGNQHRNLFAGRVRAHGAPAE